MSVETTAGAIEHDPLLAVILDRCCGVDRWGQSRWLGWLAGIFHSTDLVPFWSYLSRSPATTTPPDRSPPTILYPRVMAHLSADRTDNYIC